MSLSIETGNATLGATLTGVRLGDLTDQEFEAIRLAFLEHAVLVFPGQHMTDEVQMGFASRFGELSIRAQPFSNENDDGTLRPPTDPLMQLFRGNEGWHTDSSFQAVSAKASILSARKVPSRGGETEWADMRAAYTALPESERTRLCGLRAHHSLYQSQTGVGQGASGTSDALKLLHSQRTRQDQQPGYSENDGEPPIRELIKIHPETAVPALYIGRHAYNVMGMPEEESAELLAGLVDFACQAPRVLTHRWQPGDAVMWDNRCVLHRARPWDPAEARAMFHTRVAGDPATETAPNKAA